MFCRYSSRLLTCPHKYTTLYFLLRFNFSFNIVTHWLLLAPGTFSRSVIHRTVSHFTHPSPFHLFEPLPLSFFLCKFPGVVSKVSVRDFSAFIKVIKPSAMLLLSLNYFTFPISLLFSCQSLAFCSLFLTYTLSLFFSFLFYICPLQFVYLVSSPSLVPLTVFVLMCLIVFLSPHNLSIFSV